MSEKQMYISEVKNLIHEELHEYKESIRALGLPTEKGCFYGKKLYDYVHGKIRSDLNDLDMFEKNQKEVNEKMTKHFEAAAQMTLDSSNAAEEARKAVEDSKQESGKLMKSLMRAIVIGILGIFLTQALSSGAKLWQDFINQKETASHLEDFGVLLKTMVKEQKELKREIDSIKK